MAFNNTATRLAEVISAVCPIDGVAILLGNTARIDFAAGATPTQKSNANAALASFDWSQAAQDTWEANKNPDRKTLRDAAAAAISDIDTYLAIASPNNAQVVTQVRRLSQDMRAVIKRLIQID